VILNHDFPPLSFLAVEVVQPLNDAPTGSLIVSQHHVPGSLSAAEKPAGANSSVRELGEQCCERDILLAAANQSSK
jgi:hypothetical protein